MCGIIGIASQAGISERAWLTAGCDAIRHRGPDDSGEWWSPNRNVGLAHRRLAIIDTSPSGHQPMQDAKGDLIIVFNGEIYNFLDLRRLLESKGHKFRTSTDTEVLLEAYRQWGADCLSYLNGMFAFALVDMCNKQLFLARDRAGEKPLYYTLANGTLRFASELKALLADPTISRSINKEALDCYLAVGYIPDDRCIVCGVNKLSPAHALLFDLNTGQTNTWRYWRFPKMAAPSVCTTEEQLLYDLEVLLEDAVRRQLVADVPVGIMLSGGIDSSLVTAMASRATNQVKTFTIRLPGYGKYDETAHARLIAKHFATDHVELEAAEIKADLLPLLARNFDEPMADSSLVPTYLVCKLIRPYCTVALGGDGGDELFGGYRHYNRMLCMQQKFGLFPFMLRKVTSQISSTLLPLGFKGRNFLLGLSVDLEHGIPMPAPLFDSKSRRELLSDQSEWVTVAEEVMASRIPKEGDLLQLATRTDFENYLADDILMKVDRTSMLNSLEVRAPFLDHRITEFAFSVVPSYLKATGQHSKIVLKKLSKRLLPAGFDLQRKQGFSIPLATWLKGGHWRNLFHEVLLDQQCIFDKTASTKLLRGQDLGRSNSERLFCLVLFELWLREHRLSVPF